MDRVSVIIVSHNAAPHLDRCLDGLCLQGEERLEVILVDNGSCDGSIELFRRRFPSSVVLENVDNLGYSTANNQGFAQSTAPFVLLLNTDCFLGEGYLDTLLRHLGENPGLAGVQGKYLLDGSPERIDSLGVALHRSGVARDIARGQQDDGQSTAFSVDGLCAAAALFRREALEAAAPQGQVFDPDFGSYYEDVDLCWRLRRMGWSFACVPSAVARHVRGGSQKNATAMHRMALRNRYFTLVKNLEWRDALLASPLILGRELVKLPYVCCTMPGVLPGYLDIVRDLPLFLSKRRAAHA